MHANQGEAKISAQDMGPTLKVADARLDRSPRRQTAIQENERMREGMEVDAILSLWNRSLSSGMKRELPLSLSPLSTPWVYADPPSFVRHHAEGRSLLLSAFLFMAKRKPSELHSAPFNPVRVRVVPGPIFCPQEKPRIVLPRKLSLVPYSERKRRGCRVWRGRERERLLVNKFGRGGSASRARRSSPFSGRPVGRDVPVNK